MVEVLCKSEERSRLFSLSRKSGDNQPLSIHSKKTTKAVVFPETPVHLSSTYDSNNVFVLDETISIVKRGKDYYYKCVFTYKSEKTSELIALQNIAIDESNSKFLFSAKNYVGVCQVDLGKEYSYKYKRCYNIILIES